MSDPVVCIMGCTRGLGRAMVQRFVERGYTVVGCGRSADHIVELSEAYPEPHQFFSVDVSDDSSVKHFAYSIIRNKGAPLYLINNAGVINANDKLWEIPHDEFAKVIDINIKGTASAVRYFLPYMLKQTKGFIINLSSGWGRSTSPGVAPYCASKWAIEGMTQALAQELPSGFAAIPLNPGIINTEMLQSCFGEGAGNYPTADEWADAAVPYILSLKESDNGRPLTVQL